tara:strand:+ start:1911 stop:3284 length:1374 start_codon:yes stop_codon:yes gene_type:complete
MIKGISGKESIDQGLLEYSQDIPIDYIRPEFNWRMVQETVDSEYDWTKTDEIMNQASNMGVGVIPVIGLGYTYGTPKNNNNEHITPFNLGPDVYLEQLLLYAEAIIDRYSDDIDMVQVENELNGAYTTSLLGWRYTHIGNDSYWHDTTFLTDIIKGLSNIAHDRNIKTTHNFHSDIPDNINRSININVPTWLEFIELWEPYLDVIGLDIYPNYYSADVSRVYDIVYNRIKATQAITSKPVWILETFISVAEPGTILPEQINFTEAIQNRYIELVLMAGLNAGLDGFFHFGIHRGNAITSNNLDERDLRALSLFQEAFETESIQKLLDVLVEFGFEYFTGRFRSIANGFSMTMAREDGTYRPALDTLIHFLKTDYYKTHIHLNKGANYISFPFDPMYDSHHVFNQTGVSPIGDMSKLGTPEFQWKTIRDENFLFESISPYIMINANEDDISYYGKVWR